MQGKKGPNWYLWYLRHVLNSMDLMVKLFLNGLQAGSKIQRCGVASIKGKKRLAFNSGHLEEENLQLRQTFLGLLILPE